MFQDVNRYDDLELRGSKRCCFGSTGDDGNVLQARAGLSRCASVHSNCVPAGCARGFYEEPSAAPDI